MIVQKPFTLVLCYCCIFYVFMIDSWLNGMWLFQSVPSFFYIREDVFTWLFMQTGLHQWLLNAPLRCLIFDICFYAMPFCYALVCKYAPPYRVATAVLMLVVNLIYTQCYTLYPLNSMEGHLAWLFFPVAFMAGNKTTFSLLWDALRYFFLYFFVSAAFWKIRQQGVFNYPYQMSAILWKQHIDFLISSPFHWHTRLILWLIKHSVLSYLFYFTATVIELFFMVGFFTKKYDKLLLFLFFLFLLFDQLIMRIPFYSLFPFLLTLYFRPAPIWITEKKHFLA